MITEEPSIRPRLTRFPTTVAGLDTILHGGLFVGGVYIIQGLPGSGKTILANQICFGNLAAGGIVVYLTLLAESHSRLIQQLQTLEFFDRTAIPDRINYISAFRQLQTGGLTGVLATAQEEVSARGATVMVIDGINVAEDTGQSTQAIKRLVHDLQALASMHGCTIFLLTSFDNTQSRAEDTMVDGRILLEADSLGSRPERRLSIMKSRGDGALAGSHSFVIDQSGLRIFPRMEAVFSEPPMGSMGRASTTSGLVALDTLLTVGGLPIASWTVLEGPPGSGKTSMALHFLNSSTDQEPGLAVGFFESADRLLQKANALGLNLLEAVRLQTVAVIWRSPGNYLLDELGYSILAEIDKRSVKRLVIDGMSGVVNAIGYKPREHAFVACLFNEFRRRGVTTLVTHDTGAEGYYPGLCSTGLVLTSLADNVIRLQSTQAQEALNRSMSIVKVRDSGYDSSVRRFTISENGIVVEQAARRQEH